MANETKETNIGRPTTLEFFVAWGVLMVMLFGFIFAVKWFVGVCK